MRTQAEIKERIKKAYENLKIASQYCSPHLFENEISILKQALNPEKRWNKEEFVKQIYENLSQATISFYQNEVKQAQKAFTSVYTWIWLTGNEEMGRALLFLMENQISRSTLIEFLCVCYGFEYEKRICDNTQSN